MFWEVGEEEGEDEGGKVGDDEGEEEGEEDGNVGEELGAEVGYIEKEASQLKVTFPCAPMQRYLLRGFNRK